MSPKEIASAEREIEKRSGRTAKLYIQSVASQTQVVKLMQQIDQVAQAALTAQAPSTPVPEVKSIDEIRSQTMERAKPVLEHIWPSGAPLESLISFTADQVGMDVSCGGAERLTPTLIEVLEHELRDKLHAPDLVLHVKQTKPPRKR